MCIFVQSGGNKVNWSRVRAIMDKDIRAVAASKMVMLPLVIVPLLLCVLDSYLMGST